jgi:hypothetical protein
MDSGHEELEIVAIFRQTDTALYKNAQFQRPPGRIGTKRIRTGICCRGLSRNQASGEH